MSPNAEKAKKTLKEFIPVVEKRMDQHFDVQLKKAKDEYTELAVEYITELRNVGLSDAKRLRGAFVYYSYIMHGGKDLDAILDISAAIEVIHLYLLVEDDFMDEADTRRGYPTLHDTYMKYHKEKGLKGDPLHFGNSLAVTVGLLGAHMGMNMINNSKFGPELRIAANNRVNNQIIDTAHGQVHDILNGAKVEVTEEEVMNVLEWKTGIYTYDNPIHVGAIMAGIGDEERKKLSGYGIPGGISFQIQDDILGTFGDEEKTGKSAESDIKEGKQTLLTYYAYANGTEEDRENINKILGKRNATPEEIEIMREIFTRTGSLDYSKQVALDLVKKAKGSLEENQKSQWAAEGFDFINGIADYMIEREL